METTRKILSFHKEEKSSDPNNAQSILLDFISSCQNLRIWTLNTATREYLNNEQLQKGKQIDEWWRQVNKGNHFIKLQGWFNEYVWPKRNTLMRGFKVFVKKRKNHNICSFV